LFLLRLIILLCLWNLDSLSLTEKMTQVQQGTLLEVLKKKMRALKDELEQALEQADQFKMRMLEETRRREEVRHST